ncbi:hypothetical protein RFI_36655, partial [Reticulomyxa filosa]
MLIKKEDIRLCVESDVSKRLIESFVDIEEITIVLQKRTIREESKSAEGGSSNSNSNTNANGNANKNVNMLDEIPEESFDAKKGLNTDMVKLHGEPTSSQVVVNQSPLVRLAQLEEQKQRGGGGGANANIGSSTSGSGVLDKLIELEMKLIESQDESLLFGIALDLVKGVQECIDLCIEEQKSNINIVNALKALSNCNNNNNNNNNKTNVLKSLCEDRALNEIQNFLKQWKTVLRRSGTSDLSTVGKQIRFWEGKKSAIVELQSSGVQALQLNKSIFWIIKFQTLGALSGFPLQNVIVQDSTKATTEIFKYLDTQNYTVDKDSGRDIIAEKLLKILSKDVVVMFIKYSQETNHVFQHKYSEMCQQRQHAAWNLREEDSELIGLEKRVEAIQKIRELEK